MLRGDRANWASLLDLVCPDSLLTHFRFFVGSDLLHLCVLLALLCAAVLCGSSDSISIMFRPAGRAPTSWTMPGGSRIPNDNDRGRDQPQEQNHEQATGNGSSDSTGATGGIASSRHSLRNSLGQFRPAGSGSGWRSQFGSTGRNQQIVTTTFSPSHFSAETREF